MPVSWKPLECFKKAIKMCKSSVGYRHSIYAKNVYLTLFCFLPRSVLMPWCLAKYSRFSKKPQYLLLEHCPPLLKYSMKYAYIEWWILDHKRVREADFFSPIVRDCPHQNSQNLYSKIMKQTQFVLISALLKPKLVYFGLFVSMKMANSAENQTCDMKHI